MSFANEMARVFRPLRRRRPRGDARSSARTPKLNISPAYLRPGFAFGGSCLPKDLRALLHLARANDVDVPLLAGTLADQRARRARRRRPGRREPRPDRRACSASASRCDTDDLRESPNVELAERLIGKGFDVRIYDPIINPERLVGANLRYVEARLPHLGRLLVAHRRRRR